MNNETPEQAARAYLLADEERKRKLAALVETMRASGVEVMTLDDGTRIRRVERTVTEYVRVTRPDASPIVEE